MLIAEAFDLNKVIIENLNRMHPDNFHARLGQKLDSSVSKVYEQIIEIDQYATVNQMQLNKSKSKFMLFNPTFTYDFIPEFILEGQMVETQESMKLLGLTISNDLSWKENTDNMVKKAYGKLWMVKRLMNQGASEKYPGIWSSSMELQYNQTRIP